MKLLSEFSKVFQVDTLNVVERLSTVEASFSIVFQNLPSAEAIRSLCNCAPTRDSLKLILKNDILLKFLYLDHLFICLYVFLKLVTS